MEKVTGMVNHALIQLAENWEEWRRFVVGRIDTQTRDKVRVQEGCWGDVETRYY